MNNMFGGNSNLPPGCSINDIPGNRPEDIATEQAEDNLLDKLAKAGLEPGEYLIVLRAGLAAVKAARQVRKFDCKQCQDDYELRIDLLKNKLDRKEEE